MPPSHTHDPQQIAFSRWGGSLPEVDLLALARRTLIITAICIAFAEVVVFAVYQVVEPGRTLFHAAVAFLVTVLVSLPITAYFSWQRFVLSRANAQIARAACYDDLSGLFNRGTFIDQVDLALRGVGDDEVAAMLYVDADRFKQLNDTHGHARGDEAIRLIGNVISEQLGEGDFAGRLGGEEFAIFLIGAGRPEAAAIAGRLVRAVREESAELGLESPLTVSIGVSVETAREGRDVLLHGADKALYEAKDQGRDRVVMQAPGFELADGVVAAA